MFKKVLVVMCLSLLFISCQKSNEEITGYYKDESGFSFLHITKISGNEYKLGNSQGTLTGTLNGNIISGKTSLGDDFSFERFNEHAIYTIMGVTLKYTSIPKEEFEKTN